MYHMNFNISQRSFITDANPECEFRKNLNQRKQNKTLVAKIKRLGVHDHARNQGDISRFDTLRLCATEKAGLLMSRYNLLLETQYMPAGPNFICACLFCLYSVTYGIHWSILFLSAQKKHFKAFNDTTAEIKLENKTITSEI